MNLLSSESSSDLFPIDSSVDNSIDTTAFLATEELDIDSLTSSTSSNELAIQTTPTLGSEMADFILGTANPDEIFGLGAGDTIYGLEGNDRIQGNQGDDSLLGNQENDTLYAGQGNDTLAGGKADDILFGDIGQDLLFGDRGADELLGNTENDTLYGGKENDLAAGGAGNDVLFGDLGDDTLLGDRGADTITSGEGEDLIFIGAGTGGSGLSDADVMLDFDINLDRIGLLNLLRPSELEITQGTGDFADDTIVQIRETEEFLAILKNIDAETITAEQFEFQGTDPSPTPTPNPTPDPDPIPTPDPTPDPPPDPTPEPDQEPDPTPTPDPVPTLTPDPTPVPIPTPDPDPVTTPTPDPDPAPVPTPKPTPTPDPTPVPTPVPSNNLELTTATYLGTAGNDAAVKVEISPVDNALVIAGNFDGAGEIRRMVSGNTTALSVTDLGGEVRDLDMERDSGKNVAVGEFGITAFNSTTGSVRWSQPGTFDQVAVANDGTVATLTESTDTVTLWNSSGNLLTSTVLTGTDIRPADIAIDPVTKQVIVTGFDQVLGNLQTPFLRAFDPNLNQNWQTWDFNAGEVTGENLGADTRGLQVTFGQDGELYFLGRTDGGNNVFQRDGQDITQPLAAKVEADQFNNFSGAGGGTFTFHARIDDETGEVEQGQFIVTRLSNGNANSFTPISITADEAGNVYIGGASAASIENRDSRTINGQPVGAYTLGEPAIVSLTPDYQERLIWTPLTESGDADGSKGQINGFAVKEGRAVILGTITQPDVATVVGALNPDPLGGQDAYLATWNSSPIA
ncbi:MAG: hypothetical protein ACFBSC_06795 [Microcoleaceae cyanobacterium]